VLFAGFSTDATVVGELLWTLAARAEGDLLSALGVQQPFGWLLINCSRGGAGVTVGLRGLCVGVIPGFGGVLAKAVHSDLECRAHLTHPLVAETPKSFDEDAERNTFDRVEVDGGPSGDGVLAEFEDDLASKATDRCRARGNQGTPQSWDGSVPRHHDDRPSTHARELAPPHLASSRE
jgi:hypothetical protein